MVPGQLYPAPAPRAAVRLVFFPIPGRSGRAPLVDHLSLPQQRQPALPGLGRSRLVPKKLKCEPDGAAGAGRNVTEPTRFRLAKRTQRVK
jgi:hypothetical protein